jgi:hypothetical protein
MPVLKDDEIHNIYKKNRQKVYKIRRQLRKSYKNINKDGKYSNIFRKKVITFLLCYNRTIYSKNIILSPYLKKRLCYPILKLGYYIEHTMAQYNNSNNINYIDNEIIFYLITYKIYFVNKRMLEIYNINIKSEYNKYILIFKNLLKTDLHQVFSKNHILKILEINDKKLIYNFLIKLKKKCINRSKKYNDNKYNKWESYYKIILSNIEKTTLEKNDMIKINNY